MPARKTAPKTAAPAAPKAKTSTRVVRKTAKAAPAKATAPKARPVGTLDRPLPSGWVRQSSVPAGADVSASKMTTQTQRRLLREVVGGDLDSTAGASGPTLRSLDRLASLGFVSVAKSGALRPTKAGIAFAAKIGDAPRVRKAAAPAKAAPKAKAKAAPKAAAKATPKAKAPAKAKAAAAPKTTPREARAARQAAAAAAASSAR